MKDMNNIIKKIREFHNINMFNKSGDKLDKGTLKKRVINKKNKIFLNSDTSTDTNTKEIP